MQGAFEDGFVTRVRARPDRRLRALIPIAAAALWQAAPAAAQQDATAADDAPGFVDTWTRAFGPACFNTADIGESGTWPGVEVCPRLGVSEIYEDNVFRTADDKKGDFTTEVSPSVGLGVDIAGVPLAMDAELTYRRQARFPQNDFIDWRLGLGAPVIEDRGLHGIDVTAGFTFARSHEGRSEPDSPGQDQDLNSFNKFGPEIQVAARIGRFDADLTFAARRTRFLNTAGGVGDSRDDWNLATRFRLARNLTGGGGGGLGPSPVFGVFSEVTFEKTIFDEDQRASGRLQGNSQVDLRGGVTYSFSDITRLDLGLGVFRGTSRDPALDSTTGISARSSLNWLPTDLTNIRLEIDTELEQTQADGASAILVRDHRIEINHDLAYNMGLTFDAGVALETFRGSTRRDLNWDLGARWTWAINEALSLSSLYEREARRSDGGSGFRANSITFTLDTRF